MLSLWTTDLQYNMYVANLIYLQKPLSLQQYPLFFYDTDKSKIIIINITKSNACLLWVQKDIYFAEM